MRVAVKVELLEQHDGFFREKACLAFVTGKARKLLIMKPQDGAAASEALVGTSKVDLADTHAPQSTGAHDARLARDVKLTVGKQLRCTAG